MLDAAESDSGNFRRSQPQTHYGDTSDDSASTIVATKCVQLAFLGDLPLHYTLVDQVYPVPPSYTGLKPSAPERASERHLNSSMLVAARFWSRAASRPVHCQLDSSSQRTAGFDKYPSVTHTSDHNGASPGCCDIYKHTDTSCASMDIRATVRIECSPQPTTWWGEPLIRLQRMRASVDVTPEI